MKYKIEVETERYSVIELIKNFIWIIETANNESIEIKYEEKEEIKEE